MKNRGHVSIILGIVFLLSTISLSSAQTDESSQDELPRILVYECYNYPIIETGTLDPRQMTDDQLTILETYKMMGDAQKAAGQEPWYKPLTQPLVNLWNRIVNFFQNLLG